MMYPWQRDDWQQVQTLRGHFPHALLLYGQAGIGKAEFARHLARGLLCEAPLDDGQPCGQCVACGWFEQGNHPDFRLVVPEALAGLASTAEAEPGEADKADKADKVSRSDKADESARKTRAPSKEIKIEQVRSLLDFCALGSHRGGQRIVLLYPAETLNPAASNALLKTLEEPPPAVIFLLVAGRIDRLLPTILSRCRQWPLTTPSIEAAGAWLEAQGLASPRAALAEAGGAPLTALANASSEYRGVQAWTIEQLGRGPECDPFACGEALQKVPVPHVLGWLQRWVHDLAAEQAAGRPRYFPDAQARLGHCAAQVDVMAMMRYSRLLARQRAVEQHPLNARLVFESLMLGYREIFRSGG
jgi:DNA polymerase-3 subunit delta'